MMPWFIWNNMNSSAMGLWISRLPKITRANERYDTVEIPGRAGSLILLEGEDVYDSYVKECVVQTRRNNPLIPQILDWLRGDGSLVFSNESEYMYKGRIAAEVSFDKVSNDLVQAKIPFFVEPFKQRRYPDKDIVTLTASGTIYNPGNVASPPVVSIVASGNKNITIGSMTMKFKNLSGTASKPVVVDCDAGIITKDGELWDQEVENDFWRIPKGEVSVTVPSSTTIIIDPAWRWV